MAPTWDGPIEIRYILHGIDGRAMHYLHVEDYIRDGFECREKLIRMGFAYNSFDNLNPEFRNIYHNYRYGVFGLGNKARLFENLSLNQYYETHKCSGKESVLNNRRLMFLETHRPIKYASDNCTTACKIAQHENFTNKT